MKAPQKRKFIFIFTAVGLLVYFNSLFNPFIWDDLAQIVFNSRIHSVGNIPLFFTRSTFIDFTLGPDQPSGLYYKPLMMALFSTLYSLFGPSSFFFHLVQVTIHILNSVFVFLLFGLFFEGVLAFLLALIFLVHPVNVEAVSYVSALQEVLFFFFGINAILLIKKNTFDFKRKAFIIFLLLFALLSKETGVLFLFALLFYQLLFKRKRHINMILLLVFPFAAYFFLRFFVAKIYFEKLVQIPIMLASPFERLTTIPSIIFFYLKTFFFPKDLVVSQMWVVKQINFNDFYLPLFLDILFFSMIFYIGFYLNRLDKKRLAVFVFFTLWFLTGLGLHLQIIPLDFTVSDRWFYFPMVGLLGVFGVIIQDFVLNNSFIKIPKTVVVYFIVFLIIGFSLRTVIRNTNWQSALVLFSHDEKISKQNSYLEGLLGHEFFRAGDYSKAEYHLGKALELNPQDLVTWYNFGVLYEGKASLDSEPARQEDLNKAKKNYLKFISLKESYYGYKNVAEFLLKSYRDNKTTGEAKLILEKGVKKYPDKQDLWLLLAIADYRLGDKENALKSVKKAQKIADNDEINEIYNRIINNSL